MSGILPGSEGGKGLNKFTSVPASLANLMMAPTHEHYPIYVYSSIPNLYMDFKTKPSAHGMFDNM